MTMQKIMRILKPSPNQNFMRMCGAFFRDIKTRQQMGYEHYEIAGRFTRNGNPFVINFK